MSFHHDIIVGVCLENGEKTEFEFEYSLDDCVKNGWIDPSTSVWIRKTVDVPDDYTTYTGVPCPDRSYGEDLRLNIVQVNGKWLAKFKDIYLK